MAVRQAGRSQLQSQLYSRAQGRHGVRTDASSAAGLSTTLFGVLNLSQGRMPTHASGEQQRRRRGCLRRGGVSHSCEHSPSTATPYTHTYLGRSAAVSIL